ncbi:MAG: hypothetical protein A3H98_09620 [Bacteroidetes bacterium RIFCSPLOWO2_02_FULL_36_8]|nr:MAG: hypothetical protein A3H98_09620 [Bacteroidetes bacterium RIFCSPLOWO2_02_FULL_36_8]OFY69322.1 MAG: hypothetical protein A3G23_02345 [Bacteroidetes bacterium RIFCSPLOWO2_12_FULL_37_12]
MRSSLYVQFFLIILIFNISLLHAQIADVIPEKLNPSFHASRRQALREELPLNSCAVFFSNPIRNRSNDVDYPYHQDPDLYYLTGFTEEDAVFMIFKENVKIGNDTTNEVLFVQERNPHTEMWVGKRMGPYEAKKYLGIKLVLNAFQLDSIKSNLKNLQTILYYDLPEDIRNENYNKTDLFDLVNKFNKMEKPVWLSSDKQHVHATENSIYFPKDRHETLDSLMGELRQLKQPEELEILKKAINISCLAQIEVMKAVTPDMSEREIQGMHEFIHKKFGAGEEGYPSILGGGSNACVLHYTSNNKNKVGNNLVLMDVGAEYGGYTADVTRTIPANGKFSEEEKKIYALVLKAQNAGIEKCQPGQEFKAPHKAALEVISNGLLELGIIKTKEDARKYFPHGTSHYLGLDVHDKGNYGKLQPGMVITVEPGIYITENSDCDKKWWGIGVRIEDDILITEKGWENLSVLAPREVEEIEKLIKEESFFNKVLLRE